MLIQLLFELLCHDESSEVTNSNLALGNGTYFGTTFIHLNVIFSMTYLSFLIYPYAVHLPVPHSLIQSPHWWPYTDGSHDETIFFNYLAQCLSLFKPFTTMHIQCLPLPPCLLLILVASLMSPTASLVTTYRMQQCFNVLPDIYKVFLLLFHCCIL